MKRKWLCDYCLHESVDTIFPNMLMSAQDRIMNGIMVCNTHKSLAVAKLRKLKMYTKEIA
jgi:hypothetical protein